MNEIILNTNDNIKIAANHYENGYNEVIIICPGWFMTKDSAAFKAMSEEFAKSMDVIAMDFRGHGKSGGFYTFTSKETLDLKAVVDFARKKYQKINLLGFSLGGALVVIHSAVEQNIDKVISVSAPVDFYKIENHMWHPDAWVPTLFRKLEPKRWLTVRPDLIIRKKIKPVDVVDKVGCPMLFIAGEKDPTVFSWHTKTLYDKAVCKKKYELFQNCRHAEDLFMDEKDKFMSLCLDWLKD